MNFDDDKWRERLLAAIENSGLPAKRLSQEAGLSETFVRDLKERGQAPRVPNLIKLCQRLGIDPASLFSDGTETVATLEAELIKTVLEVRAIPPEKQRIVLDNIRGILELSKSNANVKTSVNPDKLEMRPVGDGDAELPPNNKNRAGAGKKALR